MKCNLQKGYIREYIWLGDRPVAMVDSNGSIHYIHSDHLNTPKKVTDHNRQVVWKGDYSPFGEVDETVSTIEFNLRFPGQFYDAETGLNYNYFRSYDASAGRYTQSDPIGLNGGMNTYGYVFQNPVQSIDPLGLETFMCRRPLHSLGGSGDRSGPDIWGNPFYHQYLCIRDGKLTKCGGQDRAAGPWGPGAPSSDNYSSDTCVSVEQDNQCLESCLRKKMDEPRPFYGLFGFGTNCQEWANESLSECKIRCGIAKVMAIQDMPSLNSL